MNDLTNILKADNGSLFGEIHRFRTALTRSQFENALRESPFAIIPSADGDISTVYESGDSTDYSRQSGNFDLHKDGLYCTTPPDFVLLFCAEAGRGDSPTVVIDTRPIVRRIEERPELRVLKYAELVYRGKDGNEHPRRLVEPHPLTGWPILNLGARAYVRPLKGESNEVVPTLREITRAMNEVFRLLDDAKVLRHFWKKDDFLLIDNHTFVHGREAKSVDHQRKLLRVWLSVRDKKGRQ